MPATDKSFRYSSRGSLLAPRKRGTASVPGRAVRGTLSPTGLEALSGARRRTWARTTHPTLVGFWPRILSSGPYQGTSFVWFPGEGGSVAVLVLAPQDLVQTLHILGRPGHRRRLTGAHSVHGNRLVGEAGSARPDFDDPGTARRNWPAIEAGLQAYDQPGRAVIYAAVPVTDGNAAEREAVEDLMDLFAHEHRVRMKGTFKQRWARASQRHARKAVSATYRNGGRGTAG